MDTHHRQNPRKPQRTTRGQKEEQPTRTNVRGTTASPLDENASFFNFNAQALFPRGKDSMGTPSNRTTGPALSERSNGLIGAAVDHVHHSKDHRRIWPRLHRTLFRPKTTRKTQRIDTRQPRRHLPKRRQGTGLGSTLLRCSLVTKDYYPAVPSSTRFSM